MKCSLYDYCVERNEEHLLTQWHSEKNLPLSPETISFGSSKKVWWQCNKGHEWQAAVFSRTGNKSGCPVCMGKIVLAGFNDLATTNPKLAAQWHPSKNGDLVPENVPPGTHKKVWWICEKGHEWQAQINSRVSGTGCPVCKNRIIVKGQNDLAAVYPEIAAQWHPTKNAALKPVDVFAGTRKKVWWQCSKGHEWQAAVFSRAINGCGCPVCTGKTVVCGENDLASVFPNIASQWILEKNGNITPQSVSVYSNSKVWWRCDLGHEYNAVISSRTMYGTGCPYCAGKKVMPGFNDLATHYPQIAAQWYAELNGTLTPQGVTCGSKKKVWWQCDEGHVWKAVINSRTCKKKHGCPVCAGVTKKTRSKPCPDRQKSIYQTL